MIIVIADTSGLLAALDSAHPEHQASNEAIMAAGLLVVLLLLAEINHVATRELGREAALSAVDDIRAWMRRGRIAVPDITEGHLGVAQSVRARYRDLDLDLADAVNVALAADFDTDAVLIPSIAGACVRCARWVATRGVPGASRRPPLKPVAPFGGIVFGGRDAHLTLVALAWWETGYAYASALVFLEPVQANVFPMMQHMQCVVISETAGKGS